MSVKFYEKMHKEMKSGILKSILFSYFLSSQTKDMLINEHNEIKDWTICITQLIPDAQIINIKLIST